MFWQKFTEGKTFIVFENGKLRRLREGERPYSIDNDGEQTKASAFFPVVTTKQLDDWFIHGIPYPDERPAAYPINGTLSDNDFARIESGDLKFGISEEPVALRVVPDSRTFELVLTLPGGAKLNVKPGTFEALTKGQFGNIPLIVERRDGTKYEPSPQERKKASQGGGVMVFLNELYKGLDVPAPIPGRKPDPSANGGDGAAIVTSLVENEAVSLSAANDIWNQWNPTVSDAARNVTNIAVSSFPGGAAKVS